MTGKFNETVKEEKFKSYKQFFRRTQSSDYEFSYWSKRQRPKTEGAACQFDMIRRDSSSKYSSHHDFTRAKIAAQETNG